MVKLNVFLTKETGTTLEQFSGSGKDVDYVWYRNSCF